MFFVGFVEESHVRKMVMPRTLAAAHDLDKPS